MINTMNTMQRAKYDEYNEKSKANIDLSFINMT